MLFVVCGAMQRPAISAVQPGVSTWFLGQLLQVVTLCTCAACQRQHTCQHQRHP